MSARWQFSPGLWPTVATLVLALVMSWLGLWQLDRAAQKEALFDRFARAVESPSATIATRGDLATIAATDGPLYEPVAVSGRYEPQRQFLLDNQVRNGEPGHEVLTPLRMTDGTVLMVNRGWRAQGRTRQDLPDVSVTGERLQVRGLLRRFPQPGLRLGQASMEPGWPRLVHYPEPEDIAAALDEPVAPLMLLLDAEDPHGYRRDWRPAVPGPARHYGYALQWFALTAALLAIYVIVNSRRRRRESPDE